MSIIIAKEHETEKKAMRDYYAQTLMELAEHDPRIVILDADLMNSIGTVPFAKKYPERTFNCGIGFVLIVPEARAAAVAAAIDALGLAHRQIGRVVADAGQGERVHIG